MEKIRKELAMLEVNLNDLAKRITLREGLIVNLSIAQVKEVLKITLDELAMMPLQDVSRLLMEAKKKDDDDEKF